MCLLYCFHDQLSSAVIILRSLLLKGLNSVLLLNEVSLFKLFLLAKVQHKSSLER